MIVGCGEGTVETDESSFVVDLAIERGLVAIQLTGWIWMHTFKSGLEDIVSVDVET